MSANPAARPDGTVHRGLAGIIVDDTCITDIRGQDGELRHRGYAIEDLAAEPNFENTAFLLLHGAWPAERDEARRFRADLASRRALSGPIIDLLGIMKDAPPDDALRTAISALDLGQHGDRDPQEVGLDLVAKIPSIIVMHHAIRRGVDALPEPDPSEDHAADFLRRLLGRPISALERDIINLDFVLHADHGANASTFAARVVASTGADMVAALTAASAAFVGAFHGGAVAAADRMISEIEDVADVAAFVADRRRRQLPIYGFGHRVYRTRDPRSEPFRKAMIALAERNGDGTCIDILDALVDAMAPYRRLGIDVNVDLYVTAVYRLLGLPADLMTVAFIAGRSAGWVAQVLEQRANNILIRPRLRYVGPGARDLPVETER